MERWTSGILGCGLITSIALAAWAWTWTPIRPRGGDDPDIVALFDKLQVLEKHVADLERALARPEPEHPSRRPLTEREVGAIEERVARLEAFDLTQCGEGAVPLADSLLARASKERLRVALLDVSRPSESRAAALRQLARLPEELEALDERVIDELWRWSRSEPDPRLRRRLMQSMHGAKHPEVVEILLETAVADPDESVRKSAVGTLEEHRTADHVRLALERIAAEDESAEVRGRAQWALRDVGGG